MSILIKNMEMPKSCYDCVLTHSFFRDMHCANLEGMSGFVGPLPHTDDRHPDCPLVLVPPHGKLIDGAEEISTPQPKGLEVLDKIKAEIEQDAFKDVNGSKYIFVNRVNQIIDKCKTESEE